MNGSGTEQSRTQGTLGKATMNQETPKQKRTPGKAGRAVLPIIIILAALMTAGYFTVTAPKAMRARPAGQSSAPLVETMTITKENRHVVISAMGTVTPSRTVTLRSRVGGQILETSPEFAPGGLFRRGEVILRIDPKDYDLALRKQKSQLTQAQADLALERGKQDVARREVSLVKSISGKQVDNSSLALRKPQLAQAGASVESARVAYEQARLDLERTEIKAPFNCMVTGRSVEMGSQVSTQEALATLVGTDVYWVEAAVPVDELKWIVIPVFSGGRGSAVRIRTQAGAERTGEVIRLMGELNAETRMAMVLIRVDDPLALQAEEKPALLLLGGYVSVSITGRALDDIIRLPRSAFRDGSRIWLVENGNLSIRDVETVWRDRDFIYVRDGLTSGQAVVVSELAAPVQGMPLRVQGDPEAAPEPGKEPAAQGSGGTEKKRKPETKNKQ